MEGHAEMDMSIRRGGLIWQRLRSPGRIYRDRELLRDGPGRDLARHIGGLLIAGALAAWVPESFWQRLFFEHHPTLAKFWGPLIGRSLPC